MEDQTAAKKLTTCKHRTLTPVQGTELLIPNVTESDCLVSVTEIYYLFLKYNIFIHFNGLAVQNPRPLVLRDQADLQGSARCPANRYERDASCNLFLSGVLNRYQRVFPF